MNQSMKLDVTPKTNVAYLESQTPGHYPASERHVAILIDKFPHQKAFIRDLMKVATEGRFYTQTISIAALVLLKDMFENNRFGATKSHEIKAAELKFSFLKTSALSLEPEYTRYETQVQRNLRSSFLKMNMSQRFMSQLRAVFANHKLALLTYGDCGCCVVPHERKDEFFNSKYLIAIDEARSHVDASGTFTVLVDVDGVGRATDYADDIYAISVLTDIEQEMAKVDRTPIHVQNGVLQTIEKYNHVSQ